MRRESQNRRAQRVPRKLVPFLPEALWARVGIGRRSAELTPLYVERFMGVRPPRSPGYHDYWEAVCNLGAGGSMIWKDRTEPLAPCETVLIPPRTPHHEYSERRMDLIWIGLRGTALPASGGEGLCRARSQELADAAEKVWLFSRRAGGIIGPELDGMTRTLVGALVRLWRQGTVEPAGDVTSRGIRLMHARLAEPLSVAAIAQALGCSEGYFHRVFRRGTGRTPVAYLAEVRVNHARRLLMDTEWPVGKIAELSGYPDSFYFSRVFKRVTGQAPTDYREAQKGGRTRMQETERSGER